MKHIKKPLFWLVAVALSLSAVLTGCLPTNVTETKDEITTIRVVTDLPLASQGYQQLQAFSRLVSEQSEQQLAIKIYAEDQWSETESFLAYLDINAIELVCLSTPALVSTIPQYEIYDLPYLFADEVAVAQYMAGPKGEEALALLTPLEYRPLGFVGNGYQYFVHNKPPITAATQWAGLQMVTIPQPLYQAGLNRLGITAVADEGIADSWSVGGSEVDRLIQLKKINESYQVNDPDMFYQLHVVIADQGWWGSLTEEQQTILDTCFQQAQQQVMSNPMTLAQRFSQGGVTVVPLTPEIKAYLVGSTRSIVDQYLNQGTNSLANQWITPPIVNDEPPVTP